MASLIERIAIPLDFELISGELSIPDWAGPTIIENLATTQISRLTADKPILFAAKQSDRKPVALAFTLNRQYVPVDLVSLRAAFKEFEPESLVELNGDGTDFLTVQINGVQRHVIVLYFDPAVLGPLLANYEADQGTAFDVPFEIEAVMDANAVVSGDNGLARDPIPLTLSGGYSVDVPFSYDLTEIGAAGMRLTLSLIHSLPAPVLWWGNQNLTFVHTFDVTPGTPFTISDAVGSLSGSGQPAIIDEVFWQTSMAAVITGTNTGIDLEVSIDVTEKSFHMVRFTMPENWTVNTTQLANKFNVAGGTAEVPMELRDGASVVGTFYFNSAWSNTGTSFSDLLNLTLDIKTALGLADAPIPVPVSSRDINLYFLADPGFDTLRVKDLGGDLDYTLEAFPNGHNAGAVLTATLEQLTTEDLPSGPLNLDFVESSQTATVRIERDFILNG